MEVSMHTSSSEFIEIDALLAGVDLHMPLMHPQTSIEETPIYQSLASDCYRLSLDQLHPNPNMTTITTTTLLMQMSQEFTVARTDQQILGFDLLGGTPPSAFTTDYIFQQIDQDQQEEQGQGQGQRRRRPRREIRGRCCYTDQPLGEILEAISY